MYYIFDGSYYGFLTAVFESFERKHFDVIPTQNNNFNASIFENAIPITSNSEKAKRVLKALKDKIGIVAVSNMYIVFLAEKLDAHRALFYIIQQIFLGTPDILNNFGIPAVIMFDKTLTSVNRERHRMKAFIRFKHDTDNLFFTEIEPDFNVLPLIADFFKNRYADQKWLIYDLKRKYGLYYDLKNVSEVQLTMVDSKTLVSFNETLKIDPTEAKYQILWQQYFKSTNIVARKNLKLHIQHVPKRYWKFLTEKNEFL